MRPTFCQLLISRFKLTTMLGIGLLTFGNSCSQETKPLSTEKMSTILTEMHVAEAYSQFVGRDSLQSGMKNLDSIKYFDAAILKENNTTETELRQSIDWYKNHPDLLDSVYQQVLTNISIWQVKTGSKH